MYEWMDRWMDGCGLLLEVMVFSLESSLVSSFLFFRHGYLFLSLFFGSCFFGMPSFLFFGNHNLALFYFRDVLRERSPRHGALMWKMDGGANSQCRNVAKGWDVYVLMIEKA